MYVDLQELKTYKEKLEQAKEQYQKQKDLLKEINLLYKRKKQRCIQIDKEILQLLEKPFTNEEFETVQNNLQIMQKKRKNSGKTCWWMSKIYKTKSKDCMY